MTVEYSIQELRRHEYEIFELIEEFAGAYRDYERSKEYYPEYERRYIESYLKFLKDISSRLKADAERLEGLNQLIKEL